MDDKKEKKLLIFLLIVFIVILINGTYKSIMIFSELNGGKNNLVYTNTSKIDYSVYIDENDFITSKVLGAGETYISSLTNKINMKMNYQYKGSEALPLSVKHRVVATVTGIYNESPTEKYNNPVIWKKEYVLVEDVTKNYNDKTLDVEEKFELDWKTYNEDVLKFKENFAIPTLAKLEVKMFVYIEGSNDKFELKEEKEVVANIPLSEQVFSIDANLNDVEEKTLSSKDITYLQDNQRKLGMYVVVIVLMIALILVTINKIMMFKKVKTFHSKIEEIKKDYNEIVVETKNMINTKGLKPIAITSFDEMLNLADSLITPIMLYEEDRLACFYIVKGDVMYMFIIKNKPIKNK